jgi:UDP-N-acetylmuramyl pentapeptide phosphotransferase/UDP-N-acetylglucosamine-1-phosphate transferase
MDWFQAIVPLAIFLIGLEAPRPLLAWLRRRSILDHPVERSSHTAPVPRGGGLVVVPLVVAGWIILVLSGRAPTAAGAIGVLALGLGVVCWSDDRKALPIGPRLLAQLVACGVGLALLPDQIFQHLLPPFWDRVAALALWLWFVNLYNFMDGIDAITGTETGAIGIGLALVVIAAGTGDGLAGLALAAAASALAFLRWNRHPARLFLGDVGSVPLGYLIGWLLLEAAARGYWASALILPLYYLADATITLARRALARKPFWKSHREHFYQQALVPDNDHGAVLRLVIAGDIALMALAVAALLYPAAALVLAILTTALMLAALQARARKAR